jgi:hypothetical protein
VGCGVGVIVGVDVGVGVGVGGPSSSSEHPDMGINDKHAMETITRKTAVMRVIPALTLIPISSILF